MIPMTATEVRIREEEWERINQPKYKASVNKLIDACLGGSLRLLHELLREHEIQIERMTDDGCPLGFS